jgi:phosphonate degradation associated HDIG domain protein
MEPEMPAINEIIELFEKHGDSRYGGEAVTQLEHALQAATLAEQQNAGPELIAAALLHDVGHLLHNLPADAPDAGIDDHHENSAGHFLKKLFPPQVTEPIRLHVAAKRYLCTVEPSYLNALSQPSIVSLSLQGGRMTDKEAAEFARHPNCDAAVLLRRWDDAAKIPNHPTPPLSHFAGCLRQASLAGAKT